MQSTRHRPNQLISDINVAGFGSVMLALLWLFMFIRTDVHGSHRGVPVDVPKAVHPTLMRGAEREDAIMVGITRDDKVFFRNDRVAVEELPVKIRESVSQGSEREVYIRADGHAKYAWVAEVLDGVHTTGIERIGILVEQRRDSPPSPQ